MWVIMLEIKASRWLGFLCDMLDTKKTIWKLVYSGFSKICCSFPIVADDIVEVNRASLKNF